VAHFKLYSETCGALSTRHRRFNTSSSRVVVALLALLSMLLVVVAQVDLEQPRASPLRLVQALQLRLARVVRQDQTAATVYSARSQVQVAVRQKLVLVVMAALAVVVNTIQATRLAALVLAAKATTAARVILTDQTVRAAAVAVLMQPV
jgi:hypothetical protein